MSVPSPEEVEQLLTRLHAGAKRRGATGAPIRRTQFQEGKVKRGAKGTPFAGKFIFKNGTGQYREAKGIQTRFKLKTDGRYGNKTQTAVTAFQRRKGLTVDGIVGAQTADALQGKKKVRAPGPLTAADKRALRELPAAKKKTTTRPVASVRRYAGGKRPVKRASSSRGQTK